MTTLDGTEVLYVLPLTDIGSLAPYAESTTTQAIADLAAASTVYTFPTTVSLLSHFSSVSATLPNGTQAQTAGRTTLGDNGGGVFYYNNSDTTSSDNGGTIRVDSRSRRWYYVFDAGKTLPVEVFGAFPTGSDVASAIQAAVTAAPSYTTLLMNGSFYGIGSTGVTVTNATGLVFRGPGKFKLLGTPTPTIPGLGTFAFVFSGCTESGMIGLTCLGNSEGGAVGFSACTNNILQDNDISGCGTVSQTAQVGSVNGVKNQFKNNYIHDSGGPTTRGMWIGNTPTSQPEVDDVITGNRVFNNTGTGIVYTGTGGVINANRSHGNAGSGIICSGDGTNTSSNVSVTGNVCSGNAFQGIQCDTGGVTTLSALPFGISVSGNTCEGNTFAGIFAVNSVGWTITGNTCYNNGTRGIQADNNVFHCVVTGNNCFDTRSGGSVTQQTGISVVAGTSSGTVKDVTVTGNICYNHSFQGILAQANSTYDIQGLIITGNVCSGNAAQGIIVAETTPGNVSILVSGNTCRGNTTTDLAVEVLNANIGVNTYSSEFNVDYDTFVDADTSPAVYSRQYWRANNSAGTSVTTFDNGSDGQNITLLGANGNTTLVNSSGLVLKGATNATIPTNGYITLRRIAGNWIEVGRSF